MIEAARIAPAMIDAAMIDAATLEGDHAPVHRAPRSAPPRQTGAAASLRVAFLVNDFPVLSEPFVADMAAGVLERGHEVEIIALYPKRALEPRQAIVERWSLESRAHLVPSLRTRIAHAGYNLLAQARRRGRDAARLLHPIRFGRRTLNLRMLEEAAIFDRLGAVDIVHCQFGSLARQALDHRALGTLDGKIVVHLRGYDISSEALGSQRAAYRRIFAQADHFLANCEHFLRMAVTAGCPPDRIEVFPTALDLEAFPMRGEGGAASRTSPLVASVGRLVAKKGFEYAIDAVAELARRGTDVRYEILGAGPLHGALQERIASNGLTDRVRLLGVGSHCEVAALLHRADVFVAPSVTSAQGDQDAPVNTIKEAFATGVPVVATAHGGIPEIVEDGVTGSLVPERDPSAIADSLERLLADPERCAASARAGRALVEAHFPRGGLNDRLVDIYRQVLARPRRPTDTSPGEIPYG